MARNIYLATGRQMPVLRMPETLRRAIDLVQSIAAAGRVGAAVRAHAAPRKFDLEQAGLEHAEVLTRYRGL
ncbi:hypothetical protein ACFQI3_01710 [Hansschlegelia quercus]|uniref:Uncharacterized protein n=1 Tax=Hansschlegelia quercus TaxID=2528245 RepID=A0A4Q9GNA7_9HYPH|nr:hypothetical protein [Hansschlegelia quercus]TBN54665.1 hypothetical protein EYR15_00350 [Hansschlegelia quercus]